MLVDHFPIAIHDFFNHVAFLVISIICNGLITVCMLGDAYFDPASHWQTFNAVLSDIVAHFFHIAWDIDTLFTESTIGPISWDIPWGIEGLSEVHHPSPPVIHVHNWLSTREVGWVIGDDAIASHQALVNGDSISQQGFNGRSWRTLCIKSVVILIPVKIPSPNKAKNSSCSIVHKDIPDFYRTRSIVQDTAIIGNCFLHGIVDSFVDSGLDRIAALSQFFLR